MGSQRRMTTPATKGVSVNDRCCRCCSWPEGDFLPPRERGLATCYHLHPLARKSLQERYVKRAKGQQEEFHPVHGYRFGYERCSAGQ